MALSCRPKVADVIAFDHPGCSSSACCFSTSTRCATASRRRCAGASQASCQCCLPPRTSYSGWPYSRFSSLGLFRSSLCVPGAGISAQCCPQETPLGDSGSGYRDFFRPADTRVEGSLGTSAWARRIYTPPPARLRRSPPPLTTARHRSISPPYSLRSFQHYPCRCLTAAVRAGARITE